MTSLTKTVILFFNTPQGQGTGLRVRDLVSRMKKAGYEDHVSPTEADEVKRSLQKIAQYRLASTPGTSSVTDTKPGEVETEGQSVRVASSFGGHNRGTPMEIARCPLCRRETTPNVRTADGLTVDYCVPCRLPIPRVVKE